MRVDALREHHLAALLPLLERLHFTDWYVNAPWERCRSAAACRACAAARACWTRSCESAQLVRQQNTRCAVSLGHEFAPWTRTCCWCDVFDSTLSLVALVVEVVVVLRVVMQVVLVSAVMC